MPLCPLTRREAATIYGALYSIDPSGIEQAVNNHGIDLRDLGRSKEITNELDRLLSTDDD